MALFFHEERWSDWRDAVGTSVGPSASLPLFLWFLFLFFLSSLLVLEEDTKYKNSFLILRSRPFLDFSSVPNASATSRPAPVCTGEKNCLDPSFLLLLLFSSVSPSFLSFLRPRGSRRRAASLHPRKIGAMSRRAPKLFPTPQFDATASVAPTQAELDQLLLDASAYIWIKYCRDGPQLFTYTHFRAAKAIVEYHPSIAQAAAKTSAPHQFDHFGNWTEVLEYRDR